MLRTSSDLCQELQKQGYGNPQNKIARLVKEGKLFPVRRGWYETERNTPLEFLAGVICGPSYISFEYALSVYGLIPERVYGCTSATLGKNRKKFFKTMFGNFWYQDVPQAVYPFGVEWHSEKTRTGDYSYCMARPEKALCDLLYTKRAVRNFKALEELLFEDLRIDEEGFEGLDADDMLFLCPRYKKTTISLLGKYIKRRRR